MDIQWALKGLGRCPTTSLLSGEIFHFMLESLMWFCGPPTKVISLGGRFTFNFKVGHNYPQIKYTCKDELKWSLNCVRTIIFAIPATKVVVGVAYLA